VAVAVLAVVVLSGCGRWRGANDSTSGGSLGTSSPAASSAARSDCGAPVTYRIFERNAAGSDWSKPDNLIAFNRVEGDGYYHIYTVRPNGSDLQQVGLGSATFPQRTTGSPAWSPSGAYLAFVAEKTGLLPGSLRGDTFGATPGWGGYSDLWVSTANGSRAWRLTNMPVGNDDGVLLPQFSPNGKLLEWTQKLQGPGGTIDWSLKLAHFQVNAAGVPYLTDIRTIAPGGSAYPNEFIETGGFSANSQEMLFTSDYQNHLWFENQIYELNLSSGAITRLTIGGAYNEHPRFTPNGQVIWMTDEDQPQAYHGGTDWWIMNANGSDPRRLTDFNTPSSPDSFGQTVYATVVNTSNWGTGGSYFYGDLELNLITSESDILRVSLTCR
jgi:Tol biopolymer transport system component